MILKIYLVTWHAFAMVPGPCPNPRPGLQCGVMHYQKVWKTYHQFIFDPEKASKACEGKEDCSVTEYTEEGLTARFFNSDESEMRILGISQ